MKEAEGHADDYDVAVVGGGVLGVSLYHWLTRICSGRVVLVEKENVIAAHTSSRNTGVIHRPFYLDPEKKKMQARTAGMSYFLWGDLARARGIPWNQCGTIEVATDDRSLAMLDRYSDWSLENGLSTDDYSILDGNEVSSIEKYVRCMGAIFSRTDVSTDFGALTRELLSLSGSERSSVIMDAEVVSVDENDDGCLLTLRIGGKTRNIRTGFLINAAGGSSVDFAHGMGYALDYSVLFFRGEYWKVGEGFSGRISHNIYSVPRHTGYPFLDPHYIVRADGGREIGPNAVLVSGPEAYRGLTGGQKSILSAMLDGPVSPKIRLLFNREFMTLVSSEWKSSIYKSEMAARVRRFIPSLETGYLEGRGISGVRASLIDSSGFVPEAVTVFGHSSLHILNYNSPGATGAPAYAAYVVNELIRRGILATTVHDGSSLPVSWDFDSVISRF